MQFEPQEFERRRGTPKPCVHIADTTPNVAQGYPCTAVVRPFGDHMHETVLRHDAHDGCFETLEIGRSEFQGARYDAAIDGTGHRFVAK